MSHIGPLNYKILIFNRLNTEERLAAEHLLLKQCVALVLGTYFECEGCREVQKKHFTSTPLWIYSLDLINVICLWVAMDTTVNIPGNSTDSYTGLFMSLSNADIERESFSQLNWIRRMKGPNFKYIHLHRFSRFLLHETYSMEPFKGTSSWKKTARTDCVSL